MKKLLFIFIFTVAAAVAINAQVEQCPQMLSKALDEVKTCRALTTVQDEKIKAQEKLIITLEALLEAREQTIAAQANTIKILEAIKCSETKYLFGLIKTKRCF